MKRDYTTNEVAELCGISATKIRQLFNKGLIMGYRVPNSKWRRFTRKNVMSFLKNFGMSVEHTRFKNVHLLLVVCGRSEVTQTFATILDGLPCRIYQSTNPYDLGCQVGEALGRFCWAVVDMTTPGLDTTTIVQKLLERGWQVVLLAQPGHPTESEVKETFYFPFDPDLVAARVRTLINE